MAFKYEDVSSTKLAKTGTAGSEYGDESKIKLVLDIEQDSRSSPMPQTR